MLCPSCQSLEHSRSRSPLARARHTLPEDLRMLLCERCGAVLPQLDETDALLHKLTQLSRFGLVAGDRPLLTGRSGAT